MTTKNETGKRNRNAELNEIGFSMLVLAGPDPGVDKHAQADWPHIAFTIRLCYDGRKVLDTDYKLGIGHVNPKKAFMGSVISRPQLTRDEESVLFHWQSKPHAQFKDKLLWASVAAKLAKYQKVLPQLDDVLHSLLLDGEAFFNAQSFDDWAGEFGYDSDSREAERTYRACDETGRKLANGVPRDVLEKAREIVRDL